MKVTEMRSALPLHLWLTMKCSNFGLEWLPLKDALAPVGTELWIVDQFTGDDHDGGRVSGPGPQSP